MSSVVDWSEINPELIDLIMKRLDLVDFIRAGAVCQSWRSAKNSCYISPPKSHTPWLVFISDHQPEFRYVSNPVADPKSSYKFNLPNMKHHFVIGSSHGFVTSVDEIAQVHATNPLTGSHRLLLAITTLPCCEGAVHDPITNQISAYTIREAPLQRDPPDCSLHHVQKYFYHKVVLFPTSSAGLIYVLIHNCGQELAFARQSDESWTFIESPIVNFDDVIFYKGLLYAVEWQGDLVAFDILNFSASSRPVIYQTVIQGDDDSEYGDFSDAKKYFVRSLCGSDLFLIAKFYEYLDLDDDGAVSIQTVGFKFYKLNQDSYQWSEVSSFGTDPVVVFLGFNPSVMLLAKDIPDVAMNKGDCIYFTDEDDGSLARRKKQKMHNMGIFFKEGKRICPLDFTNDDLQQFNYPPTILVYPVNK